MKSKKTNLRKKRLEEGKLCPARRHPKTFRGIRRGVLPRDQKGESRRESLERTTRRFVKMRIAARASLFFFSFLPHPRSHCYAKCDHRWRKRAPRKVIQATNQKRWRNSRTFSEFHCQNCFFAWKAEQIKS